MDKNTPMDASVPESRTAVPSTNSPRVCWALKTLVDEFRNLFPETRTEYSNYDGRNTALSVTFDLTGIPEDVRTDAALLMELLNDPAYNEDKRIEYVIIEDEHALVTMRANPRTQDSREPFGLADAYEVLAGDDEPEDGVFGDPLSNPAMGFAAQPGYHGRFEGGSL